MYSLHEVNRGDAKAKRQQAHGHSEIPAGIPIDNSRSVRQWTTDLNARLQAHAAGRGARLMEVITAAGIGFSRARTWQGTRYLERQLKNRGGHARLCPICQADVASDSPVDGAGG